MFARLWPVASFLLIIITNNQAKWLVRSSVQSSSDPNIHVSVRQGSMVRGREGGRNSCSRDSAWYLFLVGSCGRPGIMAAVTMINLAGRVVTWSSGRVAYVSMLFPSGETIDFSLSCRPCQHDVLVYHSMLDTECLHNTPINMSRPAPHAEFPRPDCEAAPAGRTRTVWAARWAPSVISGRGRGRRDPAC